MNDRKTVAKIATFISTYKDQPGDAGNVIELLVLIARRAFAEIDRLDKERVDHSPHFPDAT